MPRYDAARIEPKWQAYWDQHATFRTEMDTSKPKLYVLDMFPYPSGDGLHVGHPEGYTATDITCRYGRMQGKNVLHPMGWDAFGLPAEQYAVETGTHPRITTEKNIATFKRQLKSLGFSYDWERELATTDPDYVRWTQWIFLQLFDTWYDAECQWTGPDGIERTGRGRPISELPIPEEVQAQGEQAVRKYQDAHRLAYIHQAPVNWCPVLGTVLANEEVTADGKSDRGNHPVERRNLKQWMLRITAYAERLIGELDQVNWPESIKLLQRNWIGRSEGAEVDFLVDEGGSTPAMMADDEIIAPPTKLRVYTTRPDTLYGATYMVIAPEHPLVDRVTSNLRQADVAAYRQKTSLKSDLDRTDLAKEKSGVFTGGYAINPVNGEKIPIWIADYVLMSYGTGAIMAVPAHDERDLEFAKLFGINVIPVVAPPETPQEGLIGFTGAGLAVNSGPYTGLTTEEVKAKIVADLAAKGVAKKAINYRLRDWLFSRQRYWGEPFPIWHELDAQGEPTGMVRAVSASDLPVKLPEMEDFKPTGTPEPLLSKAPAEWLYATAEDGTKLKRETNSMPQWAGSCWYYLRFCDNKNSERFIDPEKEKYWLPVDLYIGGAEHAVLHLLYSRFWHKVLFDRGHVTHAEPFHRLVNQGMILGEMEFVGFQNSAGQFVTTKGIDVAHNVDAQGQTVVPVKLTAEDVEKQGDSFVLKSDPQIAVDARSFKMSKSRKNVINPDQVVSQYGADALRMYEMFMGPLEATKPWSMSGVEGVYRFLGRVWRLITEDQADDIRLSPKVQDVEPTPAQARILHKTIKAVTEDLDRLSFNTAISRMMEFVNEFTSAEVRPKSAMETFVLLISPLAPHIAEELWELLGHKESLAYEPWPKFDESLLEEATIEIPVQINGKVRAKIVVPKEATAEAVEAQAASDPNVTSHLDGKTIVKKVYVPGRMMNFVVK